MKEQKLVTWTIVKLDLYDRLRVLFGAKIELKITTHVPQEQSIDMYNANCEIKIASKSKLDFSQDKNRYGFTLDQPIEATSSERGIPYS